MAVNVIFVITFMTIFGLLRRQHITSMLKPILINIPTYLGLTMDHSHRYLDYLTEHDDDDFLLCTQDYLNELASQPSVCNMRDWHVY